ncbi:GtrA family protein [Paenibacillus oryzisoli]|uniref:GtrA family protein n=1 Tax=Paenibacillus oryzisoli TaxID=1850517 RepID=UPI003D2A3A54
MREQIVKFIIVGVINTGVGFLSYILLLKFTTLHYLFALVLAHIIGVLNSYLLNSNWTFQAGSHNFKTIVKFCATYAITLLFNLALLPIFVRYISGNKVFSQLLVIIITTVISFISQKYWAFHKKKKRSNIE